MSTPDDVMNDLRASLPTDDELVNYIQNSGGRVKRGTIAKHYKLKGMQRRALRETLQQLAKAGRVELLGGNYIGLPKPLPSPLVIHIHRQDGDLNLQAQPQDVNLQRENIVIVVEGSLDVAVGDTLEANLTQVDANHYVAQPIRKIANEYNLKVIEDSADTLGSRMKKKKVI